MADAKPHLPALRFAAIFSQRSEAIDWACQQAAGEWGEILLQSADIEFNLTSYYKATMGESLVKRLVAFTDLVDPVQLVESKNRSNAWEAEYREIGNDWASRPVNIDPGYLTEAKVVLMTTKDRDHRLYMGDGIYAEVTLFYQVPGKWAGSRWTYPDYQMEEFHEFFFTCRDYLRKCLQQTQKPKYN